MYANSNVAVSAPVVFWILIEKSKALDKLIVLLVTAPVPVPNPDAVADGNTFKFVDDVTNANTSI